MRQPIQVAIYIARITQSGPEYLMLHRLAKIGSFWQGVTGGVEDSEELIVAAQREMLEETELIPSKIARIDFSYSYPVEDKWRYLYEEGVEEITEYIFVAQVAQGEEPQLDGQEHDRYEWCSLAHAQELLNWPGNIEALKQCHHFLESSGWW